MLEALLICEGITRVSEEATIAAWQRLIDEKVIETMGGHYVTTAKWLIQNGYCHA
jgi:hypothetical protein